MMEMTTKVALCEVVIHSPDVTDLDQDSLEVIARGDWAKVDGDRDLIEVTKKEKEIDQGFEESAKNGGLSS
jgi:hypothetical protein